MKLPEMKTGLTISALVHAALLLWGADFVCGEAARGQAERRAAGRHHLGQAVLRDHQGREERAQGQAADAAGRKDRRAEAGRQTRRAKVTEKKMLDAAKAERQPPPPEPEPPKPAEAKPEKKEPPKIDPIAETLKKEEAKKKAEDKAKAKAAQPSRSRSRSRSSIRPRSRRCSTSASRCGRPRPRETLNTAPSLGTPTATPRNCRRARSTRCASGSANAGIRRPAPPMAAELKVVLRVLFKPDGSVATPPQLVAATASRIRAGDGGKRQARDPDLPAVHDAAARALPAMERHRDHLRPARNVRRLTGQFRTIA